MRSPRLRRPAARPTRCCTCWRSPAKAGVPLDIDDFDRISEQVPLLADLKPGGRFVATDLHRAGGIPLVAKRLLEGNHRMARPSRSPDAHRRSHARGVGDADQPVVRPLSNPIKPTGGLVILRGNLAPDGAVVKARRLRSARCTPDRRAPCSSEPADLRRRGSGARLPLRMTRPPVGLIGVASGRTTVWFGVSDALARDRDRSVRKSSSRRDADGFLRASASPRAESTRPERSVE